VQCCGAIDDDVVRALADQQDELRGLVAGLDDVGLRAATRCEGWVVADVLLHLAQTNEAAVASVEGRLGDFRLGGVDGSSGVEDVDALADAAVAAESAGLTPTEIRDRWLRSADDQLAAFEGADPSARVLWVAGDLAARTLASTRLSETWIHTVDVASASGPPPPPTDRLWHVARLAWRTIPHAFARAGLDRPGPVAFELTSPGGEAWSFRPDDGDEPFTVVRGTAAALCEVAGQRADAADVGLSAEGPDADAVLALVRTFA
jgi:uncharacterized protein (TIGR03084 family)